MNQPVWKCVGNIGDVRPLEYGGLYVFVDETGVYPPEMELIDVIGGDREDEYNEEGELISEGNEKWEIRRVVLENCYYENGILSDNQFHKDRPAWFFKTPQQRKERPQDGSHLDICKHSGMDEDEFIRQFLSIYPIQRAYAWQMVAQYHGWDNLDSYPWTSTDRKELEQRIEAYEKQIKE